MYFYEDLEATNNTACACDSQCYDRACDNDCTNCDD